MAVLLETDLPDMFFRGKVRDSYDLGDSLLFVATDRISAFDVVLPVGIPDKGKVLNQMSAFWFEKTASLVPNHVIQDITDVRWLEKRYGKPFPAYLAGRSMVVKKAERIPVECVVRGYLSGSAWEEYQRSESVCGIKLPEGLMESQRLPEPIFTPTTKADAGHDIPLTFKQNADLVGKKLAAEIQEKTIAVYNFARDYALERDIIIADTKMEFGIIDGKVTLIDELRPPDASRFWDVSTYSPGRSQPSFDKQPVRDWLTASGWNKQPPAPELPPEIVKQTAERYREAYRRLTGKALK